MKNAEEIWEQILEGAAPLLPNQTVDIWLKSCSPLRMEDDRLVLDAGNSFVAKKVKDSFLATLESVMQRKGKGSGIDLVYDSKPVGAEEALPSPQPHSPIGSNGLNRQYDFTSFVVGKSNRLAHAASLAVAESPGEAYNPLFIWGGVGLGKTHLMHAIGHFIQEHFPNMRMLYLPSEMFTNELVAAIKNNKNVEFRNRFRNVDVLMLDDIQFIAGRDSTQEEFFHTFNALHSAGKQIIISSDKPPREIARLEERLRSRFEWGLIADISSPDYETRMAILRKKEERDSKEKGYHLDDEVIQYIATNIKSNIRELEGALNRITAMSSLEHREITVELAQEALKDMISPNAKREITPDLILLTVAEHFHIKTDDIKGSKRSADIVIPRQIAMYLCREMTSTPLKAIGKLMGNRDHTTVLHGVEKISKEIETSDDLKNTIDIIKKKLNPN